MTEISSSQTTAAVDIHEFVGKKVNELQRAYIANEAKAVAALARLRNGIGLTPGANLETIGLTTAGLYSEEVRLPDAPTDKEHAVYAAVTLFALHQQSHRSKRMHVPGYSFGRSARLLSKHSGADEAVRRRFNALGTATAWDELIHHARGLIQQLRAHDIPLDYARFAVDLARLRRPTTASAVRNAWGRDFYRVKTEDDAEEEAVDGSPMESSAQPE